MWCPPPSAQAPPPTKVNKQTSVAYVPEVILLQEGTRNSPGKFPCISRRCPIQLSRNPITQRCSDFWWLAALSIQQQALEELFSTHVDLHNCIASPLLHQKVFFEYLWVRVRNKLAF